MGYQNHLRLIFTSLLLLFLIVLPDSGFSGTTGKITGRVIDAGTGEPLFGCNVIIEGTYLGAATNANGDFFILNVPPGVYRVKAGMIGYQVVVYENVQISADLTTIQDFELKTEIIKGEEVVVTAIRKMIVKDMTATSSHVHAEELENLPITEVSEVLQMQAGYVDGTLRGGRRGEVAYLIDGIPVTDSYDRSSVIDVNKNMVQELQVISGAFNAEYGKVMSGIVNITTKQGSNKFGGSIETYIGDYLSTHDENFDNINKFNPISIRNIEGSLFGSIVKDKLFYYLNTRNIYFGGWLQGQRRYKPFAVAYEDSTGQIVLVDSTALGNKEWVDMNWNRKNYLQGQIIYRLSDVTNLYYSFFYDDRDYQDYDRSYKYNPDGIQSKNLTGKTHLLKFQHQLSPKTFYTIASSFYSREYQGRLSSKKSPTDSTTYVHPYYSITFPYQFHVGGTQNGHGYRNSGTYLGKFDLTSQITDKHQIKTGVECRYHDLKSEGFEIRPAPGETYIDFSAGEIPESFTPYIHPTVLHDSTIYSSSYHQNPYEFAFYIQDKMEFTELIVNAGIRIDYFEPDGVILADPADPEIYNPIKPKNRYHDLNGNGMRDHDEPAVTIDERREYWYKSAGSKFKISPRIGISFPISDRGVFHFSYGHFFQIPNFYYLYQNPEFQLGSGTGNQGIVGNANLRPEKTVVGEIGVQQQLSDNFSIDITAYVKDIRDLTGTRAEEVEVFGGATTYSKLVNSDFGVVKGITLALNQRNPSGLYANLDYTFQIAKGTASDPNAYRNAISGGAEPEVQLNPLAWDQRHTVNATLGYNTRQYGINFIGRYGSGLPYTPRRSEDITSLLTNADVKPPTFRVDVRGFYRLYLRKFESEVFLRILNLFDTLNEVNVYNDTGRAGFTTDEERVEAINIKTPVNSVNEYFTNPTHYAEPRRIEIGVRVSL